MAGRDSGDDAGEPGNYLDHLARTVIDAALEVHRRLGPGYLESVYEEALAVELGLRDVSFERQAPLRIKYKGFSIGEGRVDLLVGGALMVELKGADRVHG